MKDLLNRLAALFALFCYCSGAAFASELPAAVNAGRRTFDSYLEKAKIQTDQSRFEKIAREGISAALFEWEKSAESLGLDGAEDWKAQKKVFERELGEEAEAVFKEWLLERKSREKNAVQKSALCEALQKAAAEFSFTDSDGKKTRVVPKEKIQEARAQWEAAAQEIVRAYLNENFTEAQKAEFWFAEEKAANDLMDQILYDHNSLKKMSAERAAFAVAQNLAWQVESESGAAVEKLFESLETQAARADADDVRLGQESKEKWLLQFEAELERGLQKWDRAEEDFLTARAEWEREAENLWANDSQKWQEAWNELEKRKEEWADRISAQIQEGEREWQKKFSALNQEISDYMLDFQKSLSLEVDQKQKIAQAKVQAYEQCRAILEIAQGGVDVWYERWSERYRGVYAYWKTEDSAFGSRHDLSAATTDDLRNEIANWKRDVVKSVKDFFLSERYKMEFFCWDFSSPYKIFVIDKIEKFAQKVSDCSENSSAQEMAEIYNGLCEWKLFLPSKDEEYWKCLSDIETLWDSGKELFGWLDLFDCFKEKADENFLALQSDALLQKDDCDELSVEKASAKALLDVWEERVAVAQAVYDYAQNNFSDIESSKRTEENLESALKEFNSAKAEYEALASLLPEKSGELEAAKSAYDAALQTVESARSALEAARDKYDELFEERENILTGASQSKLNEQCAALKALNVSSEEFEKRLADFSASVQEAFDKEFLERISEARDRIVEGSGAFSYDSSQIEGLEVDGALLEAKETLLSSGSELLAAKSLPMARLQEISDALEELLASGLFDGALFSSVEGDLEFLDQEKAALLSELAKGLQDGNPLDGEIRAAFEDLLERSGAALATREAALLLFDGSAEEIHEFFDENAAFEAVYENYKGFSAALLQEQSQAARVRVAETIEGATKANLEEYFLALDQAADGLDKSGLELLALYKAALNERSQNQTIEAQCESLCGRIGRGAAFEKIDYYIDVFEKYFVEGLEAGCANDYDQEFFDKICESRAELLGEMKKTLESLAAPYEKNVSLSQALAAQKRIVEAAQFDYAAVLQEASGVSDDSAINLYAAACDKMNLFLEECSLLYEKVKAARGKYRLAEEIYFYGQNEYLHDSGAAYERLLSAQEERDKQKAAVDALEAIQQGLPLELMDGYKKNYAEFYKARALLYRYEKELAAQKERLLQAEADERSALSKIVREAASVGSSYQAPESVRRLVSISKNSDGSYSFSLSGGSSPCSDEALFDEYFSDFCLSETDCSGKEWRQSRAKRDAIEFLESLESKPYGIAELALASISARDAADLSFRGEAFCRVEDPFVEDNYKIGDLPDSVHGVNLAESYRNGRFATMYNSFLAVIGAGGESDLAKFILFSETIFGSSIDAACIANDALKAAALNAPAVSVASAADGWQVSAAAAFAAANVFGAIACVIPFGLWAGPIAAAFTALATSFESIALKLYETGLDIRSVQAGFMNSLSQELSQYSLAYNEWKAARESAQKEKARLDALLCEKGEVGEGVSWNEFKKSLDCLFENEKDQSLKNYFYSLCDCAGGQKSLRQFFESLSKQEKFSNAREALEKMTAFLETKKNGSKAALDSYVNERGGDLSFDQNGYYDNLLCFYAKELLPALPVMLGGAAEDYQAEVFDDYLELRNEQILESARRRLEKQERLFSILADDMAEQKNGWDKKVQLVLQNAASEWSAAQEKIQGAYNYWLNGWSARYQEANDEWTRNYSAFLADKQDWIYSQYIGSQCLASQSVGGQADASSDGYSRAEKWSAAAKNAPRLQSSAWIDESLNGFFDSEKFERLSALAQNLADFSKNDSYIQSLFLLDKKDGALAKSAAVLSQVLREMEDAMTSAAATLALQKIQLEYEKSVEMCLDALEEKNRGVEKWELDMVRASGYTVDPLIHRYAVIDSALFSVKRETQWVHRYEFFHAERPGFDFSLEGYAGNASRLIMKKAQEITSVLQAWAYRIFGGEGSVDNSEFSKHVGVAAKFRDKPNPNSPLDRNVESYGSGEMGLIMLDYQWNSIRNSGGYAELCKAPYDQQLFDTGIEGLKLPTVRDVFGVVCELFASCPPLYFVKYVDDAIFSLFDGAMGYKSWDDVLNDALRLGLVAGVSAGVGAVAGRASDALKTACSALKEGAAGHIFNAAQKAAAGYVESGLKGTVNSIDFIRGKINMEQAADAWLGASAWTGAAGAFVGGALGAVNLLDAGGRALSGAAFSNIYKMNSTLGSLTGAALNYLATGDFSVNLLNVRGVGLLEVGVKDGQFFGGYGRGGVDLSYGALLSLVAGAIDSQKVSNMKNGGAEDRIRLDEINVLARSGRAENAKLARDIFDEEILLKFEDGAGLGTFSDNTLLMDKALLGDKNGLVLLASYSALHNAARKEKERSAAEGEPDALDGLADAGAAFSAALKMFGAGEADDERFSDFSAIKEAREKGGRVGVYALYAEAMEKARKHGKKVSGLAELLAQPYYQNEEENRGVVLGFSLDKDKYNEIALQNAIDRYVAEQVEQAKKNGLSDAELVEKTRKSREEAESELKLGVKNDKYGYDPKNAVQDLYGYGCTLSTAAYIAYSITGNAVSLAEANKIIKEKGLYEVGPDKNGVKEENCLAVGENYASAVNSIAGGDYLRAAGSVDADIRDKNGKIIGNNRQSVFECIVKNANDAKNVYFTHMRVNGSHSVLLDKINFGDSQNYMTSTFTVMDPWQGGKYGPKNGWADISRADFYALTESGKELYALTRKNLRAAAS